MKADPRLFQTKTYEFSTEESSAKSEEDLTNDAEGTPEDTIIYELKVRCKRSGQGGTGKSKASDKDTSGTTILDEKIYSNSIKPIVRAGMPETKHIGPIHDDILISKMRPGIIVLNFIPFYTVWKNLWKNIIISHSRAEISFVKELQIFIQH